MGITLHKGKGLGARASGPFLLCRVKGKCMELQEQLAEINRLKDLVIDALTDARAHPRELSMALLVICIEAHRRGSSMTDREIRLQLRDMVVWLMRHGTLVHKTELN